MLPFGAIPPPPTTPPPPLVALPRPGPGCRLGEGNDSGRSRDEIRIIKEMLAEEIGQFIVENRIDAPAARDLKVEPVHVQFAVLDRGPLTSCVNPSGALIGRIRDAKKGVRHGAQGAPHAIHQSLQSSQTSPPPAGTPVLSTAQPGGHAGLVGPMVGLANQMGGGEIEAFIAENRLDQGAAISLRAEPPDVREKVLAMGPLVNAVNPSAALMGRLRSVRLGVQSYISSAPVPGLSSAAPGYTAPLMSPPPGMPPAMSPPPGQPPPDALGPAALSGADAFQARAAIAWPGAATGDVGAKQATVAPSPEDSRLNAESMMAIKALQASVLDEINQDDL